MSSIRFQNKEEEEESKGTISRVLSPRSRSSAGGGDGHLSGILITQDLKRPHPFRPCLETGLNGLFSLRIRGERNLFGLAPGGVYLAAPIARGTGELLPRLFTLILWNGKNGYSTGRYVFCGTFLISKSCISGFRDSPGYGPPCPAELGLSSPPDRPFNGTQKERPSLPLRLLLSFGILSEPANSADHLLPL